MRHFIFLLALLCLPASGEGFDSPETTALTLDAAFELALEFDPLLKIETYKISRQKAEKSLAKSQIYPNASIFGQWSENQIEYEDGLPDRDYPGERYGIQVRQSVFNWGVIKDIQIQSALVDSSEESHNIRRAELLSDLTSAFLSVQLAQSTHRNLLTEQDNLRSQLAEAQAFLAAKLLSINEMLEVQSRLDFIQVELIEAQGAIALNLARLGRLTGVQRQRIENIAPMASGTFPDAVHSEVIGDTMNNPRLRRLEAELEAASLTIQKQKYQWLPEVSLSLSSQYSDVGFDNQASPPRTTESIQLGFTMPIFQGGGARAQLQGAWADYYIQKLQLDALQRDLIAEREEAELARSIASERRKAAKNALETAELDLAATRKAVKVGTGRLTDVLAAISRLTKAQVQFEAAYFSEIQSEVDWALLVGYEPTLISRSISTAIH
jgi:outer membrane protein